MATNRNRALFGFSMLVSSAVCAGSNWGSWRAVLGPIDDHEVVRWQGSDQVFGLGEALRTWPRAELVPWSINGRYRPSYTLARLVEASFFGGRPGWWYVSHLVLQSLSVGILALVAFLVLRRAFRGEAGIQEGARSLAAESALIVALVVALAGMRFWNDVITRLGPSEICAVAATAVCAIGAYLVHTDGRARWWVPTVAGFVVAATSKENFAFLLLPLWVVGAGQWHRRRAVRATVASMTIATLAAAVVLGAVLVHTVRAGGDVYGRPVGTDRWRATWEHWSSRPLLVVWVVIFVASTCVVLASVRRRADLLVPAGLALCWPVLRIADTWFNAGQYASHRYFAIHDLCLVAEIVTLLSLVFHVASHRPVRVRFGRAASTIVATVVVAASLALPAAPVLAERRVIAERNIVETKRFQDIVDLLVSRHDADPSHQFVMVIDKWSKYEPAVAVTVNLRARGIPATRSFLRLLRGDEPATGGGAVVTQFENDGSSKYSIAPIASFSPGAPTTCVFLFRTPLESDVAQCEGADRMSYFTGAWWARG